MHDEETTLAPEVHARLKAQQDDAVRRTKAYGIEENIQLARELADSLNTSRLVVLSKLARQEKLRAAWMAAIGASDFERGKRIRSIIRRLSARIATIHNANHEKVAKRRQLAFEVAGIQVDE